MPKKNLKKTFLELLEKSPLFSMQSDFMRNLFLKLYENATEDQIKEAVTAVKKSDKKVEKLIKKYPKSGNKIEKLEAEAKGLKRQTDQTIIQIKALQSKTKDMQESEDILDQLSNT